MAIHAVLFDFGGVLMRTVSPVPRRQMERRFGLPADSVEDLIFGDPRWDQAQLGRVSSAEFWTTIGNALGLSAAQLAEFRQAFWAGDQLDDQLISLIRHLHQAGYRTGLLSNGPADFGEQVEQLVTGTFDAVVISGSEGVMKPDPAAYRLALDRLGVPAEETVFIDDSPRNVTAARQLGLHALRFTGVATLHRQLGELGLPTPDVVREPVPDVQAVIFDWGGVMERGPDEAHVTHWAQRLGVGPEVLADALWGKTYRLHETGALGEDEFNAHIAQQLGLPNADAARHFIAEFYDTDSLNPQVVDAVRALRRQYRVGLLSNAFPDLEDWIERTHGLRLQQEFDTVVNSSLVGLRKPDPAIYTLALERLQAAPERTIYLDDNQSNVDSARALGIHALQFDVPETALAELEALLGHALGEIRGGP